MIYRCSKKRSGFTLAELLIALAILAVIATFTIPKVLTTQTDQTKKSVFKETIAAINDAFYAGWVDGSVKKDYNGGYILDRVNAVKLCRTNAQSEGCWPMSEPVPPDTQRMEPGFTLANGSAVAGLSDSSNLYNSFIIDWNGPAGPNVYGDDQIFMRMCYGKVLADCVAGQRPGTIVAPTDYPVAVTLYQQIFN